MGEGEESDQHPEHQLYLGNVSFRDKLSNAGYRRKFCHTVFLFWAFFVTGIRNAQHGPSLIDFAQITSANLEEASVFFTSLSLGGMVGTPLLGWLFDRFPRLQLPLLALTNIGVSCTTVALPWSTYYPLTIALFFITQFCSGGVETICNADLVAVWSTEGKMFLQFLHFALALGAVISPLLLEPFLAETHGNCSFTENDVNATLGGLQMANKNGTFYIRTLLSNCANANISLCEGSSFYNNSAISPVCSESKSNIHYAYLIAAILSFTAAIPFMWEMCRKPDTRKLTRESGTQFKKTLPLPIRLPVWILLCIFYGFHCGAGGSYIGYLFTFIAKGRGWTKEMASVILFAFWASLCVFRLIGVVAIKLFTLRTLLIVCQTLLLMSLLGVWLMVHIDCDTGLWFCVIVVGAGTGPIFSTGLSYVESEIMHVTSRIASAVMVSSYIANMVNPLLMGHLLQDVSFMWFVYLPIIYQSVASLSFAVLILFVLIAVRPYKQTILDETEITVFENKTQQYCGVTGDLFTKQS